MMEQKRAGLLAFFGVSATVAAVSLAWWAQQSASRPETRPMPVVAVLPHGTTPAGTMPGGAGPATGHAGNATAGAAAENAPRFDVARIGSRGTAVVAGRAAPGAEVSLQDNDKELGRARADTRGEWVILPVAPLTPGAHELSLRARLPDGQEQRGVESVVVLVPEAEPARPRVASTTQPAPAAEAPPLVVLMPDAGSAAPPRILQGGGTAEAGAQPQRHDAAPQPAEATARLAAAAPPRPAPGRATATAGLGLDVVDYDEGGALRFSGSAPGGSTVRVYIDQGFAGDATADAAGRWALQPEVGTAPGLHTLRVDQIGQRGAVAARLELPFQRDRLAAAPAEGQIVVQPGHNLWRIARVAYGRGIRYTTIYRANREQIRDPGRIYPGQVFALPAP
jgi:nucleoid-associated protein YgaU